MTSATTSESLIVNVAVSTANGLPYRPISSSRIRPDPWQTTLLACLPRMARQGLTQWVAYHIGGKPGPVIGPAVHVLLVASAQELQPAQLALVIELLDEQVFAAVDDRFHHHVDLAALALGFDDLLAFVDGRSHRHGAGDVLSGVQGFDRHPGVVRDRRVDVDGVDVWVFEKIAVVGVAGLDSVALAAFVERPCGRGGKSRRFPRRGIFDRSG